MRENYINAVGYGGDNSLFRRVSALFTREPETDRGLGEHYIIDIVGAGGSELVSIVCQNHDMPLIDLRDRGYAPGNTIRDMVQYVMEKTPPRCAIVLDIRDNEFMKAVRSRIAHKYYDLRYRRSIFCLTDRPTTSTTCLLVPGSVEDRITMLLYHLPDRIRDQVESFHCFHPLAEAMVDYALFRPQIWRHVHVEGALHEFLSTALYQVVRRVRSDPCIGDAYPSFEMEWRRSLATRIRSTLPTPPEALCPSIHRVIPIGVSPSDAIQAMETAIPKDLQHPYAVTVLSSALDDQCGSIAITQPMQYTVVNVTCTINPGILVDVCRELRTSHKAIAREVHLMKQKMSVNTDETNTQLSMTNTQLSAMKEKHEETNAQLTAIQNQMAILVAQLAESNSGIGRQTNPHEGVSKVCAKAGCERMVTKRYRSGKAPKQCNTCLAEAYSYKRPDEFTVIDNLTVRKGAQ